VILDHKGNPIEPPAEPDRPHRFGFFEIPDDARVTGFAELEAYDIARDDPAIQREQGRDK
jgi:hypothetical protein